MSHHKASENSATMSYALCRSSLPRDEGRRYFASSVLKSSTQALYGFLALHVIQIELEGEMALCLLRIGSCPSSRVIAYSR